MKISIITATYNSERNLTDCLQSVANQDYPNIEHIVIDGASKDRTLEIVKSFSSVSRYISEPDRGIYDALNKGIQLATGDVIGFVHSDDMLASPHIISAIANEFLSPPPGGDPEYSGEGVSNYEANNSLKKQSAKKIHGVYGNLVFVDPDDTNKVVRTWISTPFDRKEVSRGWAPPHPTLYLRREVYEQHGLFDISFRIAGDYDQMLRIMRKESIHLAYLPETIVRMRKGGASTGNFGELLCKKGEDLRVLRNNGFRFPFGVLLMKNLRKIPQLLK
ncbi:glycosyltransferase family 2 protein [Maribellus mangrovi]|uniref:glycosyltransferase family 2 protein n=1 Tax=Maribellus mangrovi TaxID=3133146 RepID=UPI0030ECD934